MNCTYSTVIANNEYLWGGMLLALSFKATHSKYPFNFIISDKVDSPDLYIIDKYQLGNIIRYKHKVFSNAEIGGHAYQYTRGKLEVLNLTQFDRVCNMDADILLDRHYDEFLDKYDYLFLNQHDSMPWHFNTTHLCGGMFIVSPNKELYEKADYIAEREDNWADEEVFTELFGLSVVHDRDFQTLYHFAQSPKYWMCQVINENNMYDIVESKLKRKITRPKI